MYFVNREEAGNMLAKKMSRYQKQPSAIIALSDGAVLVAAPIARVLDCPIMMLMTEPIKAPGEPDAVASINQEGTYATNPRYSTGEIEEFDMEYRQTFEQEKMEKLAYMHRMLGQKGVIRHELLRNRNIILVSDGLESGFLLDSAALYLKTIKINKIIVATPLASVPAVDRMHILADDLFCLSVVSNYMTTNHYYEDNMMPSHETIIATVQQIVDEWRSR